MAGSRLPYFGTIFSRTTGLLKSKALQEKPIWYDVYKKHPPELEPYSDRPEPPQTPILEIVYEEDFDRVQAKDKRNDAERSIKEIDKGGLRNDHADKVLKNL